MSRLHFSMNVIDERDPHVSGFLRDCPRMSDVTAFSHRRIIVAAVNQPGA